MSESPNQENRKSDRGGFFEAYKEFGPYLTLGFQLAAAVVLLFFAGDWLDRRYDTSPLFSLLGVGIGTLGGLIKFIRSAMQQSKSK